jgi:hypothetical protein
MRRCPGAGRSAAAFVGITPTFDLANQHGESLCRFVEVIGWRHLDAVHQLVPDAPKPIQLKAHLWIEQPQALQQATGWHGRPPAVGRQQVPDQVFQAGPLTNEVPQLEGDLLACPVGLDTSASARTARYAS